MLAVVDGFVNVYLILAKAISSRNPPEGRHKNCRSDYEFEEESNDGH